MRSCFYELALAMTLATLAAAAAGCGGAQSLQGPMPEAKAHDYRACTTDAQCVYATNGCCDCANGGDDIAVNKDKLAIFRSQFQCAGVACTEIGGFCGQGTVACEQGLCVYHARP